MKVIVVAGVFFALVLGGVFVKSFPGFCANPDGAGNWIVVPFCGGAK